LGGIHTVNLVQQRTLSTNELGKETGWSTRLTGERHKEGDGKAEPIR